MTKDEAVSTQELDIRPVRARKSQPAPVEAWKKAQESERVFWGNCVDTLGEQRKQRVYANRMKIRIGNGSLDLGNKSILDVGGGPVSLLLGCFNFKRAKVVDPCAYPDWVYARYAAANIETEVIPAEEMKEAGWDEVWMYNVLQHVVDPELVAKNALKAGKVLRLFEWVNAGTDITHPHELKPELLNLWLGKHGMIEWLDGKDGCIGWAYYGVFANYAFK